MKKRLKGMESGNLVPFVACLVVMYVKGTMVAGGHKAESYNSGGT